MESEIKLYHGSKHIILRPQYGMGSSFNDYGQAFYCTQSIDMAMEWACSEDVNGYANEYVLHGEGLRLMDLSDGSYHILNWLAILLDNRTFRIKSDIRQQAKSYILSEFLPDYQKYDCIKGYRADDSYFSFADAFLNNQISLRQLKKAMMLGELGEQLALRSKKAFSGLEYVDSHSADRLTYYVKRNNRDQKAREDFQKMKAESFVDAVYMIDLLRQRWRNDDERLR